MKKAKLLHALLITVMLSGTVVISLVLVHLGRSVFATAGQSLPSDTESESQTEQIWTAQIEYDLYTPSEIEPENFRGTVILGNSQAQALSNYGLIRDADFVTRVGLSINNVLTAKTGPAPIDAMNGKKYAKAVFVFGENELGWPYPRNFITHYKKVIEKVREMNPGIEIYCQAIFPVSAEYSSTSTNGITNENVRLFNGMIEEMCAQIGAHYMPVTEAFFDRDGVLPADAATDGVHFNYDYCKIWVGDLSAYLHTDTVQPELTETTETAVSEPESVVTTETAQTTEEGVTQE